MLSAASLARTGCSSGGPPNFLFVLTDDQRYDALGSAGNRNIFTPTLDSIAARGIRFSQAIVTTSICAPSRATCLTGRYGSRNGVPSMEKLDLNDGEPNFVAVLQQNGYLTGYVGKWHLRKPARPEDAGFDWSVTCAGNGPHYSRTVVENGTEKIAEGFIEDYFADRCLEFIELARTRNQPFFLQYSTQAPHMDHEFSWKPKPETWQRYQAIDPPLPESYSDDLKDKPPYLAQSRSRQQALRYGYDKPEAVKRHTLEYWAAVTDMDRALGRVTEAIAGDPELQGTTYVAVMGDNGWMIGEHGFTSKVLAYEESIRVPFLLAGPGILPGVSSKLVLNADLASTFVDLAQLGPLPRQHGRSLVPVLMGSTSGWRDAVLYESFERPSLGAWPQLALRTDRWKYIGTFDVNRPSDLAFEELYDLQADPAEMLNLARSAEHSTLKSELVRRLQEIRTAIAGDQVV